ncbi:MAG: hypothetical protein II838_01900 [Lachnospiraceae bacterium]|nr:hypothetical protein [Lachnospiraceae bacterium]
MTISKRLSVKGGSGDIPQKAKDIAAQVKSRNGAAPQGYRGAERIVIGDDDSVWCTNDHYHTFIKVDKGD